MNNNLEMMKLRIKEKEKELKWLKQEYERLSNGEDPFGDPGSLSEAEAEALAMRQEKGRAREAFKRIADKKGMNEILKKLA